MWPNYEQPITTSVDLDIVEGLARLTSKTKGASIAYIISDKSNKKLDLNCPWQLYKEPISVEKGKVLYTIAQRIGYKESKITIKKI